MTLQLVARNHSALVRRQVLVVGSRKLSVPVVDFLGHTRQVVPTSDCNEAADGWAREWTVDDRWTVAGIRSNADAGDVSPRCRRVLMVLRFGFC